MTTLLNAELSRLCADKGYKRPKGYSQPYYNHLGILNGDVTELVKAQINEKDTTPFQTIAAPTIADVVMWLYEKHNLWIYSHKDGGWWFPVIENYYDEDNRGTIIEDLSKMSRCYFDSPTESYEAAIDYILNNLI